MQAIAAETRIERYAWMILAVDVILSLVSALITTLPPITWFWNPLYTSEYSIMGAWGISWIGFEILALIVILIPFRRGERWAWFTLWLLPALWVSLFILAPDLIGLLVLALISITGLLLSWRRFFPKSEEEPPRVK